MQTTEILFFRLPMSDFGRRKHSRTSENAPASAQRIPNVVQRCSGALPAPRPGCPAPPSGSSKTYVFLKETVEFPLSKVARNRHPGVYPFVHQSPLRPRAPIPRNRLYLPNTRPSSSPHTPPCPPGAADLLGLRPLTPTPKQKSSKLELPCKNATLLGAP